MRYYQDEHESAYRAIERLGYTQWNDLLDRGGTWTYDHFQNRAFLERTIPQLALPAPSATRVLEYGCGTGPAACFLAGMGFEVEAFDLIPEAIAIARRMADARGVRVDFRVADVCELTSGPGEAAYDLVLDSFCLQSIVTDEDREAVFAAVRARLKPAGFYLLSTAIFGPERTYEPGTYDAATGIALREIPDGFPADRVTEVDGRHYIPHRRHRTADALRNELVGAGFDVISLEAAGTSADVVCRRIPSYAG